MLKCSYVSYVRMFVCLYVAMFEFDVGNWQIRWLKAFPELVEGKNTRVFPRIYREMSLRQAQRPDKSLTSNTHHFAFLQLSIIHY